MDEKQWKVVKIEIDPEKKHFKTPLGYAIPVLYTLEDGRVVDFQITGSRLRDAKENAERAVDNPGGRVKLDEDGTIRSQVRILTVI